MSEEEKGLYKIPDCWMWAVISMISNRIHYGYTQKAQNNNIGPKFLRITDIQNDKVDWEKLPFCKINDTDKQKYLLNAGDIVFARTGATVGKSYLISNYIPESVFASYLIRIILNNNICNKYISYFFKTAIYWNQIINRQAGIGQPNVNATKLASIPIPLPPLNEQHRIVAKIEELFTRLDAGVEILQKARKQIKQYRQSVLKYAFEGKLTEKWREEHKAELEPASVLLEKIRQERKKALGKKYEDLPPVDTSELPQLPAGWDFLTVGFLYDIIGGGTPSTKVEKYWYGDIPWITSADIHGIDDIRPRKMINVQAIKNSTTNLVPALSIIVVTRVSLGKIAITKAPICFSQDSQALVGNQENIYPKYALYYLSKKVQIFKYKNRGTTIKGVTKKQLAELVFILPPLQEQHQIVQEIEKHFTLADYLEKTIDDSLAKSKQLRQAILKKAFEGRLVPQDPNDEPASELLKRIKLEKEKTKTPGKQGKIK